MINREFLSDAIRNRTKRNQVKKKGLNLVRTIRPFVLKQPQRHRADRTARAMFKDDNGLFMRTLQCQIEVGIGLNALPGELSHKVRVGIRSFAAEIYERMDTRIIKVIVALASIAYTVYLYATGHWGSGIGMTFVSIILVLAVMRSVRMIFVFFNLQQQKVDKAKKWLNRINPNHLWKRQQGYYYFLLGSTSMETNLTEAERHLRKALSIGLRKDHDKAAVKLNLAAIASAKRRMKEAKLLLAEAKKLDKKGMLKSDIKMIEKAMKNPRVVHQRR